MARKQAIFGDKLQVDDKAVRCSDDECVKRLAAIVEHKNNRDLRELSRLISRLAVPIE